MQQLADVLAKPGFQRAATNLGWLLAERAVRFLLGVVVGFIVARHLGPSRLGELSYCTAIVTLAGGVAALGLDAVVKRDLLAVDVDRGFLCDGPEVGRAQIETHRWCAAAIREEAVADGASLLERAQHRSRNTKRRSIHRQPPPGMRRDIDVSRYPGGEECIDQATRFEQSGEVIHSHVGAARSRERITAVE